MHHRCDIWSGGGATQFTIIDFFFNLDFYFYLYIYECKIFIDDERLGFVFSGSFF